MNRYKTGQGLAERSDRPDQRFLGSSDFPLGTLRERSALPLLNSNRIPRNPSRLSSSPHPSSSSQGRTEQ